MLERPDQAHFAPAAQVFPGGSVDQDDHDPAWAEMGLALKTVPDEREGMAFRIAAIRETFEECGIILARGTGGGSLGPELERRLRAARDGWRRAGARRFRQLLNKMGATPAVEDLVFCAHWITPLGFTRRFDARFFMVRVPEGQEPVSDPLGEHRGWRWAAPDQVLEGGRRGEFQLLPPTRAVLEQLARARGVDDALERARGLPVVTRQPAIGDLTADRYPGLDVHRLESP